MSYITNIPWPETEDLILNVIRQKRYKDLLLETTEYRYLKL